MKLSGYLNSVLLFPKHLRLNTIFFKKGNYLAHDSGGYNVQVAWFGKGLLLHSFMTEKQKGSHPCGEGSKETRNEERDSSTLL